jgi:hypothetical protein
MLLDVMIFQSHLMSAWSQKTNNKKIKITITKEATTRGK